MPAANLIVRDARVITLDASARICQALAVRNGKVVLVGSNEEVLGLAGRDTRVLDAGGRAVIPGLVDGHAHMDREGLKEIPLSLSGVRSIDALQRRIAGVAATKPAGAWIVTMPIGDSPWAGEVSDRLREGRMPTRHDLDEAAPDHPVYIRAPWGYWRPAADRSPLVSIANSMALQRSGIDRHTQTPLEELVIERDDTGTPTGVFFEPGPAPVAEMVLLSPETRFTHAQRVSALVRSMEIYNGFGTTAVFEGHGVSPDVLPVYVHVASDRAMTVRATLLAAPVFAVHSAQGVRDALTNWFSWAAGRGLGNDWLRVAGVYAKSGRTAAHRVAARCLPYTGWAGYTWDASLPRELLGEFLAEAARLGLRVGTLFADCLDLFERADNISPIAPLRWVVGHVGLLDRDQVRRIRDLGAVVTLHANRSIGDIGPATVEREPGREQDIMPTRWLLEDGVPFALSSDNHPPTLFKPLWHCVSRRHRVGGVRVAPQHALTREEALRAATAGGAWLTFDEAQAGELSTGRRADFVLLSDDPLACAEDTLADVRAEVTVVGGRVVFERASSG